MKIEFQEWIFNTPRSTNVSYLFDDCFKAYRASAYRASLLFSYLGFLTIVKETILISTKPTAIPQSRWDKITSDLVDDDKWEKVVYEEIINSSNPIFNTKGYIREQVKYWKDRRNDCAHFKVNKIEYYHVESFWSFVKSNLLKITIEGGKESLLNKFEQHFDLTLTPANADFTTFVNQIEQSVDGNDLPDFWKDLILKLDPYRLSFNDESNLTKVFKKVIEVCPEEIISSLCEHLKKENRDLIFVSVYPELIQYFKYSPTEVRRIWKSRIFNSTNTSFIIYTALLRNSLIPAAEINEANNHIFNNIKDRTPKTINEHIALAANGFGDVIHKIAIVENKIDDWYEWTNPRADILAYYIEKYPLKIDTVKTVCEMYTKSRYSHWLGERIERLFNENISKKDEFHKIANDNSYTIPSQLL